jgi:hypothetical protein
MPKGELIQRIKNIGESFRRPSYPQIIEIPPQTGPDSRDDRKRLEAFFIVRGAVRGKIDFPQGGYVDFDTRVIVRPGSENEKPPTT